MRLPEVRFHIYPTDCDMFIVRSGLLAVKTTSYIVRQEVWKVQDDTKVAEANIVFVAVGQDGRPVRVPDSWREMLPHWPEAAY